MVPVRSSGSKLIPRIPTGMSKSGIIDTERTHLRMKIFFDVDYTLIADDGSLRPHVKEVFQKIKDDGHCIFIWSGVGLRWEVVKRHELDGFIETCYIKPLSDYKDSLGELGVKEVPDFCIDDHNGVVMAFGGTAVRPYYTRNPNDEEMLRVYEDIKLAFTNT